ncbi:hypothetical protein OIDMADRAFT_133618 [Oidiodendron maius Zn]|uniref:Methyltransferase domain-containing protein n=1 Tax=Oidiodendron maius (strain Zn) TaxID=913774 RepID=A0A0C3GZM5_OIDMZ|nr:hypothetical protein OIDMADRAFT_133618 [Oidiodendron maius Zn]
MGKLVLAPIDLSVSGLRILDSATADGLWLRDLESSMNVQHTYIGTDITKSFFPSDLPQSISLQIQSMHKPWPASWLNTIDLVHQRYGLAAAGDLSPHGVVTNLLTLVKPGGWIQLVEADFKDCSKTGPVMTKTHQLTREAFDFMGSGSDYARQMKGWLLDAGLEDVEFRTFDVRLGAQHPDPELGAIGVKTTCQASAMMVSLATTVMKSSFEPEELKVLVPKLKEELETTGGTYRLCVVWGRKPTN